MQTIHATVISFPFLVEAIRPAEWMSRVKYRVPRRHDDMTAILMSLKAEMQKDRLDRGIVW